MTKSSHLPDQTSKQAGRWSIAWEVVGVCFLYVCLLAQNAVFRAQKSATYDETFYLSCVLQTVHDGRVDGRLAGWGVAPLAPYFSYLPTAIAKGGENRPDPNAGQLDDPPLITSARATTSIVLGLGLVLVVYLVLRQLHGPWVGIAGVGLLVASPTIITHTSLATTDGWFTLTWLIALVMLAWYRREANWTRFALLALAISISFSTKYGGVVLLGVAGLAFFIDSWRNCSDHAFGRRLFLAARQSILQGILLTVAVVLLSSLWHGFSFVPADTPEASGLPLWRRFSLVHGFGHQLEHSRQGHPAYLMGEFSNQGWISYFPIAFVVKSTPWELLLFVVAVALGMMRLVRREGRLLHNIVETFVLGAGFLLLVLLTSKINIGQRYLLPLYPILFVVALDQLWDVWQHRPRWLAGSIGLLLLGQAATAFFAAPHYLAYFSPLVGGCENGALFLVDSNLDWGQDLPALRDELQRLGYRKVLLYYFGTAAPEAYGVSATPVHQVPPSQMGEYEAIAISVTYLQGAYTTEDFRALRQQTPVGKAGYSIRIYDLRKLRAASREE